MRILIAAALFLIALRAIAVWLLAETP